MFEFNKLKYIFFSDLKKIALFHNKILKILCSYNWKVEIRDPVLESSLKTSAGPLFIKT